MSAMVRRALCIGCNYPGSKMKLNGCVNDCATNVQLCVNKLGVPPHEVIVLADEELPGGIASVAPPTKQNIINSIKKFVHGAQAGDMFYFSYSGHGTQVVDRSGEEEDGMDEAIVPGDYEKTKRVITDDELDAYLVKPLPEGALLTAIFDCCHSGTILDLDTVEDSTSGGGKSKKDKKEKAGKKKYKKGKSEKELKEEFAEAGNPKAIPALMDYVPDEIPEPEFRARGMGGPTVFCFAGCRDDQTSLDVTLNGKPCGALTNSLQKAFHDKEGVNSDYESVFRSACHHMNDLRKTIPQLSQCPQFTYTEGDDSSRAKFCQPGSVGGGAGYSPSHPPVMQDSHEDKDKKGKKEKGGKDKKEKKEKGNKTKDLDDSSDSSASEDKHSKKEKKDKKEKH